MSQISLTLFEKFKSGGYKKISHGTGMKGMINFGDFFVICPETWTTFLDWIAMSGYGAHPEEEEEEEDEEGKSSSHGKGDRLSHTALRTSRISQERGSQPTKARIIPTTYCTRKRQTVVTSPKFPHAVLYKGCLTPHGILLLTRSSNPLRFKKKRGQKTPSPGRLVRWIYETL